MVVGSEFVVLVIAFGVARRVEGGEQELLALDDVDCPASTLDSRTAQPRWIGRRYGRMDGMDERMRVLLANSDRVVSVQ